MELLSQFNIEQLICIGMTPTQAVDYYFVEVKGYSQIEWAEERGVDHSSVSDRVRTAKKVLNEYKIGNLNDNGDI